MSVHVIRVKTKILFTVHRRLLCPKKKNFLFDCSSSLDPRGEGCGCGKEEGINGGEMKTATIEVIVAFATSFHFLTDVLNVILMYFLFFGASGALVGPPSGATPAFITAWHLPESTSQRQVPPQSSVYGMHWAVHSTLSHSLAFLVDTSTHDRAWQQLEGTQSSRREQREPRAVNASCRMMTMKRVKRPLENR